MLTQIGSVMMEPKNRRRTRRLKKGMLIGDGNLHLEWVVVQVLRAGVYVGEGLCLCSMIGSTYYDLPQDRLWKNTRIMRC